MQRIIKVLEFILAGVLVWTVIIGMISLVIFFVDVGVAMFASSGITDPILIWTYIIAAVVVAAATGWIALKIKSVFPTDE